MGFVVYLGEVLEIKVRINLGAADIGMPEQFLHAAKIVAGFEHMRRERMAKHMRVQLCVETLSTGPVLDPCLY